MCLSVLVGETELGIKREKKKKIVDHSFIFPRQFCKEKRASHSKLIVS